MRCRKHHCDFSSSVGVCASCLRDRLFTLIAAQSQAQSAAAAYASASAADDDPLPPPLYFPRSVSPYVSHRRKTDENSWNDLRNHQRFFSTPQIGRTSDTVTSNTFVTTGSFDRKPKSKSRFSLWSRFFRSRSDKFEKNHNDPSHEYSNSSSPSWFSTIFTPRTQNKQSNIAAVERRNCRSIDRGMSPARISDFDGECEEGFDRSPIELGQFSDQKVQQSPMAAKRGRQEHKRNVSGFAFCLSPLVRANPNRNWNHGQKGFAPDISFSGDLRVSTKPHLCANRSKKIADFGRVNHNR